MGGGGEGRWVVGYFVSYSSDGKSSHLPKLGHPCHEGHWMPPVIPQLIVGGSGHPCD